MPDSVSAVVGGGVVDEPHLPPHMFQRCPQPTNKDMGAAGVDADAALHFLVAAVADWRPDEVFGIKLKKENEGVYDYTGTWAGVGGPQGLPLFKPPFSTVTAIDMNTGKHLWRVPAGKGPVDHPAIKDLKLDRVGVPRESFIALTDDVLFLAPEGTNSVIGLSSRGNALITQATAEEKEPFLYAHDARTGDVLGEVKLPGAAWPSMRV